jgi:hypothetical protein
MLVKQFKFRRNNEEGGFQWTAESEIERPGFYRGFTAVGKTLSDVKEFAALVRRCERTGKMERLSENQTFGAVVNDGEVFELTAPPNQCSAVWRGGGFHDYLCRRNLSNRSRRCLNFNCSSLSISGVIPLARRKYRSMSE